MKTNPFKNVPLYQCPKCGAVIENYNGYCASCYLKEVMEKPLAAMGIEMHVVTKKTGRKRK